MQSSKRCWLMVRKFVNERNIFMKKDTIHLYLFFATALMLLDRLTKYLVMYMLPHYKINEICSIDLVFNRGISFGLFHSDNVMIFTAVNMLIGFVVTMLLFHAFYRVLAGQSIRAEVCIFVGALSNIIDRYVYGGVIDFIALSYRNWHFAVFNVADMFIFCGVVWMLFVEYKSACKKK